VYVERAVEAVEHADHVLSELQDSMLPVEVGDRELRDGLSEVRETIAELPARARRLMRAQGR
jgi:regulator of protease activity HflC (stomatin/prohibitin superfamily)